MKNIVYILLLLSGTVKCQIKLSSDQSQILNHELLNIKENYTNNTSLKRIIGDSLLVSRQINYDDSIPLGYDLKKWCVDNHELTTEEANEIFGNGDLTFSIPNNSKTKWLAEDFPDYKIAFYDGQKKSPRNNVLGTLYNVFSLSIPSIRNDGRFASIHVANSDGGQLKIYKKITDKWVLYKSVWLYWI